MDFDKLDLANLVLVTFRKFYQKVKHHGFEKIMDFSMDIDKLNLANLVGKVLDEIIWSSRFFYLQNNFSKGQTALFFAVRK